MFQSATSETKSAGSRVRRVPVERESELHPFHATNGHGFSGPAGAPPPSAPHPLAAMHRAVGNQAVLRNLSSLRPTIQTKLTINTPGDQYEREADRVAEQVMRMPDLCAALPAMASGLRRRERDLFGLCQKGGTPALRHWPGVIGGCTADRSRRAWSTRKAFRCEHAGVL
jgi:hypothetical protein